MNITANFIVHDLGVGVVEQDRLLREKHSVSIGNHRNARKIIGKADICFAEVLCDKGFGNSTLLRPGLWFIEGYYFYPKSNRWTLNTQERAEFCGSFHEFVVNILKDTTFCKVDKK